jgi:hypothetical protein
MDIFEAAKLLDQQINPAGCDKRYVIGIGDGELFIYYHDHRSAFLKETTEIEGIPVRHKYAGRMMG